MTMRLGPSGRCRGTTISIRSLQHDRSMKLSPSARLGLLLSFCALSACASVRSHFPIGSGNDSSPSNTSTNEKAARRTAQEIARDEARKLARIREEAHSRLKAHPRLVSASSRASEPVRKAALADRRLRIAVSVSERTLWLMRDTSVLFSAPVAVGMEKGFTWAGKS